MGKLDLEETLKNLKLWRENSDEAAATILVSSNIGLVKFIAKKYINSGLSFEDLESTGMEGLVKAINMFDYINRPISSFSSYIARTIENYMLNEIKKNNKHRNDLSLETVISNYKNGRQLKLEDIVGTDENQMFDTIINRKNITVLREALKCLTPRELEIIMLRYGFEGKQKTIIETSIILGTNRHTVSIQEKKTLIKIRNLYEKNI